jgi:hypothetical protein
MFEFCFIFDKDRRIRNDDWSFRLFESIRCVNVCNHLCEVIYKWWHEWWRDKIACIANLILSDFENFQFFFKIRMMYLSFSLSFFRIIILFCKIFRSLWSSSIKSYYSLYSLFIFLISFLICWIIFNTRFESFVI